MLTTSNGPFVQLGACLGYLEFPADVETISEHVAHHRAVCSRELEQSINTTAGRRVYRSLGDLERELERAA
jgi:hypothetical protein